MKIESPLGTTDKVINNYVTCWRQKWGACLHTHPSRVCNLRLRKTDYCVCQLTDTQLTSDTTQALVIGLNHNTSDSYRVSIPPLINTEHSPHPPHSSWNALPYPACQQQSGERWWVAGVVVQVMKLGQTGPLPVRCVSQSFTPSGNVPR